MKLSAQELADIGSIGRFGGNCTLFQFDNRFENV